MGLSRAGSLGTGRDSGIIGIDEEVTDYLTRVLAEAAELRETLT